MTEKPVAYSVRVEEGDVADPIQQLKNGIKQIKESMPYTIEMQQLLAKIAKTRYDALIKEGFPPDQALFLVK